MKNQYFQLTVNFYVQNLREQLIRRLIVNPKICPLFIKTAHSEKHRLGTVKNFLLTVFLVLSVYSSQAATTISVPPQEGHGIADPLGLAESHLQIQLLSIM